MKRSRMIAIGLAAVSALVLVGFVLVQQLTITSAAATPELQLTVSDPQGSCVGEKCTLDPGQAFTLAVEVVKGPTEGYVNLQSAISYGSDLVYNKAATAADEIAWPDVSPSVVFRSQVNPSPLVILGGYVSHSGITGLIPPLPVSNFEGGNGFELAMNCSASASSTVVELIPMNDARVGGSGAGFVSSDGVTQLPSGDTLTINCGAGAGPTETPVTPTGPTATPTLTGTPGPATDTPTPAPPTNTPPPPPPTATPPDLMLGDVDCDGVVSSLDALLLLQLVAQLVDELSCPDVADVNEDGMVDAVDALWILWIEAGLI